MFLWIFCWCSESYTYMGKISQFLARIRTGSSYREHTLWGAYLVGGQTGKECLLDLTCMGRRCEKCLTSDQSEQSDKVRNSSFLPGCVASGRSCKPSSCCKYACRQLQRCWQQTWWIDWHAFPFWLECSVYSFSEGVRRPCRRPEKFSPPVLQRWYGCSFDAQEIVRTGHGMLCFYFSVFGEKGACPK